MVRELSQSTDIIYPDSDGQPMTDLKQTPVPVGPGRTKRR